MRRVTVTLLAGVIFTTLPPTVAPAGADVGFWRSAGRSGVDAFGVYRTGPARVRLSFLLRDTKKDGYRPAVRFTFAERHRPNVVRVVTLRHGRFRQWRTARSANTSHLYVQECVGSWRKKKFRVKKCGGWRRRY